MKNKIKQFITSIVCGIAISFCLSCEDTMLNNMVDDKVYLLNNGLTEVDVYNIDQPIITVNVMKSGAGQRQVELKLTVDPNILTTYNQANGTSYKLLDESVYTLDNTSAEMTKETYQVPFNIAFDTQKFALEVSKDPEANFAIPCQVTIINPVEGELSKMETIIIPRVVEPYIKLSLAGFLTDVNNILPSSPNTLSYYSKVEINYAPEKDVEFSIALAEDFQSLIAQYNEENNTSYVVLPEGAYTLEGDTKIPLGTDYAGVTIKVFKDKLVDGKDQPLYGHYILPIEINQVSLNKIDPNNNFSLIPFSYHE